MIRLENVLKLSLQDALKTSWRRLQYILKTSSWRLENVLKTSWRRLQEVLKTFWRRIYCSWPRRLEEVLKTSSEDVRLRRTYSSWSKRLEDFLYKMLQKQLWNTFSLYVEVEIQQLVNEISSLPEVLYKRGDLKTSRNSQIITRSNHLDVFLFKDILKNFAKFTDKHLWWSFVLNKVAGWKPEIFRSSYWTCSIN